jgi:peptidoglycan/xylan/chitin deacetylase (PgdA/CDA1 family)
MTPGPRAVILMYHRVARTDVDPWGLCVSPDNFAAQMEAIRRVAEPLPLLDLVRNQDDGSLPIRSVVVTFDDGYLDNLEQAMPLLSEHAVPATLFVATGNIDTPREFWWDTLESVLLTPGRLPDRLVLPLPGGTRSWRLGAATEYTQGQVLADRGTRPWAAEVDTRLHLFHDVWLALWPLAADQRQVALDAVAAWGGSLVSAGPVRRTLGSAEIRAIASGGLVTIGAHTVDHPPLPAHPLDEQRRQIEASKRRLEELLGAEVSTFAYPHGEHDSATTELVRESGFTGAVTVEHRPADRHSDPLRLPRYAVQDVDGETLAHRLDAWFAS